MGPGLRRLFQKAQRSDLGKLPHLRRGILGNFIGGATRSSGRDSVVAFTSRPNRLWKVVNGLSCVVMASNLVPAIKGLLLLGPGGHHLQPLEYLWR